MPLLTASTLAILAAAQGCSADAGSVTAADALSRSDLPVTTTVVPTAGTFTQEIAHGDPSAPSVGTFTQHYWYTNAFASGPDAPVLLRICDSGDCSARSLRVLHDTAKVLGATVMAIEHRYYGDSLPYPDLTLEHMKYLTVHNALEDVAAIERFAQKPVSAGGLGLGTKWIPVGSFYGGMLAAYYRERHPELAVGAWASSAPFMNKKFVPSFDAAAANILGARCTGLVQRALAVVETNLNDPQHREAFGQKYFGDPHITPALAEMSASLAPLSAAYGDTHPLCSALEQHADTPLDALVGFIDPPVSDDTSTPPPPLALPPIFPSGEGDFKTAQWFYQVCTEIGLFEVASPDRRHSVLSPRNDAAFYQGLCERYIHRTDDDIAETSREYYAPIARGEVSNLYVSRGDADPFAGVAAPATLPVPGGRVFTIAQGRNGEDITNLKPDATLGVFESHANFVELARGWLR